MTKRPRLSELSASQLLTRAQAYRDMAATASTDDTRLALEGLAMRFAALAAERTLTQPPRTSDLTVKADRAD